MRSLSTILQLTIDNFDTIRLNLNKLYHKNRIKFHDSVATNISKIIQNFLCLKSEVMMVNYHLNVHKKIVESELRNYIGIHWRTESIKVENLSTCANDLIRLITKFKNKYDTKSVYLATCYPLYPRYEFRSTTFRDLINFHRDAVKKLLNSGHKADDYLSMNILKDMRNDPKTQR
nr:13867_t:CDS:2 [Entrophospora candida]